ncbi:MAG: hypothetical protein JWO54_926 [Candidatus Saccharibacteria bacterium]|nr:hypothetical protein [Candidatus Saccharibacteria bacterium]
MWFKNTSANAKEKSTQSFNVKYLGGHSELSLGFGTLHFYTDRFEYVRGKKTLLTLPSSEIETYNVEGKEDISRRITATRMVTLGIFALATPKKNVKREQYLTIILKDGNQLIFEHTNQFINEALFRGLVSTAFAKMLTKINR